MIYDRLEALPQLEDINHNTNVIKLLQLIQTSLYNHATMKKAIHTYIDAESALQ